MDQFLQYIKQIDYVSNQIITIYFSQMQAHLQNSQKYNPTKISTHIVYCSTTHSHMHCISTHNVLKHISSVRNKEQVVDGLMS